MLTFYYLCLSPEHVPLSSNYASVRHVPSLDSISSVMDGLHLQDQKVVQVVGVHTYRQIQLHRFV